MEPTTTPLDLTTHSTPSIEQSIEDVLFHGQGTEQPVGLLQTPDEKISSLLGGDLITQHPDCITDGPLYSVSESLDEIDKLLAEPELEDCSSTTMGIPVVKSEAVSTIGLQVLPVNPAVAQSPEANLMSELLAERDRLKELRERLFEAERVAGFSVAGGPGMAFYTAQLDQLIRSLRVAIVGSMDTTQMLATLQAARDFKV